MTRPDVRATQRLVCALGIDAAPVAEIFAALTARGVGPVCRQASDIDTQSVAVVVTTSECVTPVLLDILFPRGAAAASVPGLIFAPDVTQLEKRARSIAENLRKSPAGPVIELFPFRQFDSFTIGPRSVLGSKVSSQDMRKALTSEAALLSVCTHSNGYDLIFKKDLVLCDALPFRGRPEHGAPCCQKTGQCYRLHKPISELPDSPGWLRPAEIRTRIFLLCTCLGILPDTEEITPAWGYADALLENPHLAALITSWTWILPSANALESTLQHLYRGESVGKAVAQLNNQNTELRFAVLGDPEAHITPLDRATIASTRFNGTREVAPGDGGRFLNEMMYQAAFESTDEQQLHAFAAADDARTFEHACALGLPVGDETIVGRAMRDSVAKFMEVCGSLIFEFWIPLTSSRSRLPWACDVCGSTSDRFVFEFRLAGLPAREMLICPCCGIRRDSSVNTKIALRRQGRTLILDGELPKKDWRALLHFGCQDRRLSKCAAWPVDASGTPAREFVVNDSWPPGPLILGVILVAGTELAVLTIPASGDDPKASEVC